MKTTPRPASTSRWLGCLATVALGLGTVSATALSTGTAVAGASGKQVTVSVMTVGKSKVLVAKGKPLYFLKPSAVSCGSGCLKIWPALTLPAGVSSATAGTGVQSSKLGTTTGPKGLMQVTYGGQPVYWFAKDNVRGKVKGNFTDKWGKWTAVVVSKGSSGSSGAAGSGSSGSGSSGNSGGTNAGSGGASF
jgi:predicted lipoprotein with Yx(FWY)xxD motif